MLSRKKTIVAIAIPHIALAVLLALVLLAPKSRPGVRPCLPFVAGILIMEALYLWALVRKLRRGGPVTGPCDLILFLWSLLSLWELYTSVLNLGHPVLVPAPENVFDTFREQWRLLALNVAYSLQLLVVGLVIGLTLAVILGMFTGWYPRLRAFAYPIANVMAPIPPVVFSPYLVALMPTFRSASALVIVLGVFWPTYLSTINRVTGMEPQLLDLAKTFQPDNWTMIWQILFPYLLPATVSGLRVTVTTSLLMLNFAELMGATHGMGYYVQNSVTYANYAHALAGIGVIGVVVTLLSWGVGRLQRVLIPWR